MSYKPLPYMPPLLPWFFRTRLCHRFHLLLILYFVTVCKCHSEAAVYSASVYLESLAFAWLLLAAILFGFPRLTILNYTLQCRCLPWVVSLVAVGSHFVFGFPRWARVGRRSAEGVVGRGRRRRRTSKDRGMPRRGSVIWAQTCIKGKKKERG